MKKNSFFLLIFFVIACDKVEIDEWVNLELGITELDLVMKQDEYCQLLGNYGFVKKGLPSTYKTMGGMNVFYLDLLANMSLTINEIKEQYNPQVFGYNQMNGKIQFGVVLGEVCPENLNLTFVDWLGTKNVERVEWK